ncbi:MAG: 50S ribosomal protein L11 methyltransferase [bacterium]
MVADRVRTDAYAEALRRVVHPGHVVVDIGTGTGIFALLACRWGARRVYAIEPDGIVGLARELAVANGFADRIEFIQDLSTRVVLPERGDVVVSDLRGVLPLSGHHISSIIDARQRFLAVDGILVPLRDTIWAAPVDAPDLYRLLVAPWDASWHGLNVEAARRRATNTWSKVRVTVEELLAPPQRWASLHYPSVERQDMEGQMKWTIGRSGALHGLCVWFETVLVEGVGFSTGPDHPELIYGNGFFPLSSPAQVEAGDTITVTLQARLVGEDYLWSWETQVEEGPRVKATVTQSNFFGSPPALTDLRKQQGAHIPVLREEGEIDRFILARMDGGASLVEIARLTAERFPERFPSWQEAMPRVGALSSRYSR